MAIVSNTDARRPDQRVTFQQKSETQDPNTGEILISWVDFVTVWACVDATKANERFAAQQELSGNDYTLWVRWRGDLDSNMRVLWKGRMFDITGIPDNQRRGRWLSVFVTAGINDG